MLPREGTKENLFFQPVGESSLRVGPIAENICRRAKHWQNPGSSIHYIHIRTTMTKFSKLALALIPAVMLSFNAGAADDESPEHKRQKSPKGAKSYIVNLRDGKTYTNRKNGIKVIFGLTGMGISPAGLTASGVPLPNTGHHHLLVDVDKLPPMDKPLAADQPDTIKHFGKGQTEVMLKLKPGKHTLQLVLGDYAHVPHDPPIVSKKITITVK